MLLDRLAERGDSTHRAHVIGGNKGFACWSPEPRFCPHALIEAATPSNTICRKAGYSFLAAAGASMNASNSRPFCVIIQPPFRRSTNPCAKIDKPGALAANRFVRSDHSFPLVARIAMSRFRFSMVAKPPG